MKKHISTIIILVVLLAGSFIAGQWLSCDYFQRKNFTEDDTDQAGRFELCIKAQIASKTAGGNVMNCDDLIADITTAGKLKNFRDCFDFYRANKEEIDSIGFNCKKLVFPDNKK